MALHAKHRGSGVRGAVAKAQRGQQTYAGALYETDPILQQVRAMGIREDAIAQSHAADQRRQELLNFGYVPGIDYGDAGTQQAAEQAPFSVVAQLQRGHQQRVRSMDENLNKANLYYSSYRGKQLGDEGTAYLGEQAGAQQHLQGILGQIADSLAGARQGTQERLAQAEQDAYQRALARALKYGYGTGRSARAKGKGRH